VILTETDAYFALTQRYELVIADQDGRIQRKSTFLIKLFFKPE
jgi:hypothetical protein